VQLDEPSFAKSWDQFSVEPTLEEQRKFSEMRVEALNHALHGIPRELVRFHCCWGSWHGPHSTDAELANIVGRW
jgi:5-methyltetrahydropteroyltriglutamate--homocysteine methyltransferase